MNEHVETLSHIKAAVLDLAFKFGPRAVIVEAFRSKNIVIPFPQQEVRMVGAAA